MFICNLDVVDRMVLSERGRVPNLTYVARYLVFTFSCVEGLQIELVPLIDVFFASICCRVVVARWALTFLLLFPDQLVDSWRFTLVRIATLILVHFLFFNVQMGCSLLAQFILTALFL